MTDLDRIEKYIADQFKELKNTISRIGSSTDTNVNNITELTVICRGLTKELDVQKKDIQNLYDRVNNRVKISTVFWIVGIAVSIMGVVSTIVASHFSG